MSTAAGEPINTSPRALGVAGAISSQRAPLGDRIYRGVLLTFAMCVPLLLVAITYEMAVGAWPALSTFGPEFFTSSIWDSVRGEFGIAPAIYGTLVTSFLALLIATPFAVGVAIFLSDFAPRWLTQPVGTLIDLLAAIPSIVYGLWGWLVLIPILRDTLIPFLTDTLGLASTPFFAGANRGPSILAASIILAIMVLPYISSVSREILLAVPRSQREAALALGATKWEMVWGSVLPFAKSGIFGGIILGLGRALGETMAVVLLIGNAPIVSASVLSPGYTLASLIANKFRENSSDLEESALLAAGLCLLVITLLVNALARWLVMRTARDVRI